MSVLAPPLGHGGCLRCMWGLHLSLGHGGGEVGAHWGPPVLPEEGRAGALSQNKIKR